MRNARSADDCDYTEMARVCDRLLTPVVVIDVDSTLRYANGAASRLVDAEPRNLTGRKMLDLVHPNDRERVTLELEAIVKDRPSGGFSQFRVGGRKKSDWRVFDSYAHNLIDDPKIRGILVSGGDATEQVNLSTALTALTKANHVLMHAADEASIMATICDAIIESGRHMLAWVGYAEHDPTQSVRLVSASGSTACLESARISWGNNEFGGGPTGRAIRTGSVQVIKDVRQSRRCVPWTAQIEGSGMSAACSIPLRIDDVVVGALTIYSRDPRSFDPGEVELLAELADNLSSGISRLRHADNLARSEAHLREAERLAHVGHWEWNLHTQRLDFKAQEMLKIYGVPNSGWQGDVDDFLGFVPGVERELVREALEKAIVDGASEIIHRVNRLDGEERVIHMRAELITNRNGHRDRIIGVSIDITDQTAVRNELEHSRQFHLAIADNMTEGMIATDTDGTITFANAAAGRLVNLRADDMIGTPTPDVFRFKRTMEGAAAGTECPLRDVWSRGERLRVDYDTIIRRDGSLVPVAYSASPLIVGDLKGAVIVFEDITNRVADQLKVDRELQRLAWIGRIRDALDQHRLVHFSQPIIHLATGEIVQNELLLRMVGPGGEIFTPDQFLPTAEEYGLIKEIDDWVIGEATHLAAQGQQVEFNLSAKSVIDPRFIGTIRSAIEASGARPEDLVCEITETALVDDLVAAGAFVRELNEIGVRVALDDFGAGYGGFSYLKHLPVSYLKIDREFVRDINVESSSQFVVAAVVNLARAFGMLTVAEGIENAETLTALKELGVDYGQGFFIGRPMPLSPSKVRP